MTATALSESALHDAASRAAGGLSDFGDAGYLVGLRVLLDAAESSPARGEPLRRTTANGVVDALTRRLHSERGWTLHPGCRTGAVRQPLVITGIPRTGTTALHQLLSVDEQFQWIPTWLAPTPMPRPPREAWESYPTYRAAVQQRRIVGPSPLHDTPPDGPDECLTVMMQSFVTMQFASSLPVPGYHEWFITQDETASYRRYRDNLLLIGAEDPDRRWLLKNPSHTFGMAALFRVFPDALVVQTHRDPAEAITSGCSVINHYAAGLGWSPEDLGRHRLRIWALAVERAEEVRAARPNQFHDVDYRELLRDPMAVARGVYERFGITLSPETDAAMRRWVLEHPQGQHGAHRYTPEQFGLTADGIRAAFADYIARHRLATPSPPRDRGPTA